MIGIVALVDTVWFVATDVELSIPGSSTAIISAVAVGSLLFLYSTLRRDEKIAEALSSVLLLLGFSAATAPLSYLVAWLGLPLWDGVLQSWDEAMGLSWRAYLAWMNDHPTIAEGFKFAYQSLMPQAVIVSLVLGLTGRRSELRAFTLAIVMSGVLCVLLSGAMPALGTYFHFGLEPRDYPNFSPAAPYSHIEHVLGLRDGTFKVFSLNAAEGIITFPSYHASLAVIFLRGLWSVPVLRWPGVILNVAVLAATPINGGHYFVDVGAGIAIAMGCLWIARDPRRLFAWQGATRLIPVPLLFRHRRNWAA